MSYPMPTPTVTEDAAASYMRVAKEQSQPSVGQLIQSCSGAHPSPKRVLAEVCNLYECGGRLCFDANNRFLAEKLGITIPMVSRHLHALERVGLLLIDESAGGGRRRITPAPKLREAYQSGKGSAITEVVRGAYLSGKPPLTGVVSPPYRSGKHNTIEYKEEGNRELLLRISRLEKKIAEQAEELAAANAACQERKEQLLSARLEIADFNIRIEKSLAVFREQEAEIANLKASTHQAIEPAAPRRKVARAKTPTHTFAESPYASLEKTIESLAGTDYEHADLPYYHELVRNWAESKGEKKADWLAAIRNWILRDSKEGKLKTNPNSTIVPNANPSTFRPQPAGLIPNTLAADLALCRSLGLD